MHRIVPAVATIEHRGTAYRVAWRLGGKRTGKPQSVSIKIVSVPGGAAAALKVAEAAKAIAEGRGHAVTRDEVRQAVLGDSPTVDLTPTLNAWVDIWFEERAGARDVQPDVLGRYRQTLNQLVAPRLGHLRLTQITQQHIRDWVAWANGQQTRPRGSAPGRPLSAQTVRRAHSVLRQVLGAAVGRHIAVNPAAHQLGARKNSLGLPKAHKYEGMFLDLHELQLILDNCSPEMRDIATVAVWTGLRLGELLVLRVEDVVLTGKYPHVKVRRALKNDGSIGAPKSQASRRDVGLSAIDDDAYEVFKRRREGRKRSDLYFPAPRGGVWCENNLRQRFWLPAVAGAQRCAEHPPPLPGKAATGPRRKWRLDEVSTCSCETRLMRVPRIHDLRHTHASILIEAGWEAKAVQVRMGHSSITVTMDIYGHLWKHGEQERLTAMSKVLRSASGVNPLPTRCE